MKQDRELQRPTSPSAADRPAAPCDEFSLLLGNIDQAEVALERAAQYSSTGGAPSDSAVLWGIYRRHMLRHAQAGDWSLYRDTRLSMACLLEDQGKSSEALDVYLEVAYLDANGPRNTGTCFGHREPDPAESFDPSRSIILPAVVLAIVALSADLGLSKDELRDRHMVIAETARRSLRAPLSVQDAWSCLSKAMLT